MQRTRCEHAMRFEIRGQLPNLGDSQIFAVLARKLRPQAFRAVMDTYKWHPEYFHEFLCIGCCEIKDTSWRATYRGKVLIEQWYG
jgi:hypothetical protein